MPLIIEYRPIVLPAALAGEGEQTIAGEPRPRPVRAGAIAATLAVGAMMLLGFGGAGLQSSEARASAVRLQPFERAGENFPGSAFYYLAPASGVVRAKASANVSIDESAVSSPAELAIARPIQLAGTGEDRFRALHCLTTAIYYEAATEPDAGQRAVAQVVLNRVAHPQWPNSVCEVVYQGSERPGCQFSFACDGSMARAPARMWWLRARAVAERALAGEVYAPAGLATYYHTGAVHPAWADRMQFIGAIGAHLFYRPSGAQGVAAAFTDRYWGGEPSPVPRPRLAYPSMGDPLAETARLAPSVGPRPQPPALRPATLDMLPDKLPPAGQVRPEFRNSGRWLTTPGAGTIPQGAG